MRRGAKRDANHNDIADAFRAMGCSVFETDRVGEGFPDIIVGLLGVSHLVEIKNPETAYGRAGLNQRQSAFANLWRGSPIITITSEAEAAAFVNKIRNEARR